jgi:acetyl-CoA carboxylase/biotin carboxylase 1
MIEDLNREELPLIIFANWRGFSGGMRDMYEEVIKYGAMIVDGLRTYNQPVFIYLPPHGELRGGAWVVIDPTINPDHMEMYADKESRGGVLEPEGTVEIKFKTRDLVKTMSRLDHKCIQLQEQLNQPGLTSEKRAEITNELKERQLQLAPIYHQVAVEFADLHDTPGRMKAKGVISDVLEWPKTREFFYWKLRRRLCEQKTIKLIQKADSSLGRGEVIAMLRGWFVESKNLVNTYLWHTDKVVVEWLEMTLKDEKSLIYQNIDAIKRQYISRQITSLLVANKEIAVDSLVHVGQSLSAAQRREIVQLLSKSLET